MAQASVIILLLHLHLLFAQVVYDRKSVSETQNDELNPDSVVLNKLGDFFLNVDEAFSRFTEPKVEAEDRAKEHLYGKTQPARSNYFGRIRENYRNLQKRIGSSLGFTGDVSILSDLFGINVQNKDGRSSVDVDLPFLPMRLSTSSKQVKDGPAFESSTASSEESVSEIAVPEQSKLPEFSSNLQLGDIKIDVDSKSFAESPRVQVDIKTEGLQSRSSRQKLRIENVAQNTASNYDKPTYLNRGVNALGQIPEDASTMISIEGTDEVDESPETEGDSEISGRILGDLLYSESTFDKIMKRVIKDSRWFLDSDLSPSKVFERLNRFTRRSPQRREESSELSKNDLDDPEQLSPTLPFIPEDEEMMEPEGEEIELSSENLETPTESMEQIQYEIDEVPSNQENIKFNFIQSPGSELNLDGQYEENILVAFTPQGVPLKLKIPPEVEDPLQFLHDTLNAADVSLNIPVETYDDIVPVGRDILQLGSGRGGLMSQAFYVDLSEYDQVKSLLKILRKFTSS